MNLDLKELFQSKKFKAVLYVLGVAVIVLLIFQAGMFVGYRKAGFAYRFGDNYYRTFGGRMDIRTPFLGMQGGEFPSAHGAIGKIIKISLPILVIEDQDNVEKVVLIKDNTLVRRFRDKIESADLKVDDFVVVIGSPNDKSEIEARLVRILPSPPDSLGQK